MINLYRLNTSALQEQIHFCNEQSYSRELMTQRYDESYKLHYQALVCTVWEYKMRIALCSRNFQNVNLRLDIVEIWSFYQQSDFTWNQSLPNSNGPKMLFLPILEVPKFDFSKFEPLSSHKFTKFQSSEALKLPKMTFLDCLNLPKFDFT